jgi:hypothetical protein
MRLLSWFDNAKPYRALNKGGALSASVIFAVTTAAKLSLIVRTAGEDFLA